MSANKDTRTPTEKAEANRQRNRQVTEQRREDPLRQALERLRRRRSSSSSVSDWFRV